MLGKEKVNCGNNIMNKTELIEIIKKLLKTETDLDFLLHLPESDLETLVVCTSYSGSVVGVEALNNNYYLAQNCAWMAYWLANMTRYFNWANNACSNFKLTIFQNLQALHKLDSYNLHQENMKYLLEQLE